MSVESERARLEHARGFDIDADARDLAELGDAWEPCYAFKVDYRRPLTWTATPADGSPAITAPSAADLRALLRQAKPVTRP